MTAGYAGGACGVDLRLDGSVDVAVDLIGADPIDNPIHTKDFKDLRLGTRNAEPDFVGGEELVDLRELRRALRVHAARHTAITDFLTNRKDMVGQTAPGKMLLSAPVGTHGNAPRPA